MNDDSCPPLRRALLSVSDKTHILQLAQQLLAHQVELLSTGGTSALLTSHHLPVTEVSSYTGFPEIMQGRVKTLHPKIHGGLLGRRGIDDEVMAEHGIQGIDLLVVNLYPFQQTIAQSSCSLGDAIENIDIGGPAMIRAAAKNFHDVAVVVDSNDYPLVIKQLADNQGGIDLATRQYLASKAFAITSHYDAAITSYLTAQCDDKATPHLPAHYSPPFSKQADLRYGENPHQTAAFYISANSPSGCVASAEQLQGKALSYNNIADSDAALECVKQFSETPACVIVKHANPCGVALADTQVTAYQRAFATDPTSSFGGIIAFNDTLNEETAQAIIDQQFVEVIIAPQVTPEAQAVIASKPNVRLLACGVWPSTRTAAYDVKPVTGGLLVQTEDNAPLDVDKLKIVTQRQPTKEELSDLAFAWQVAQYVKSNAIVYAKNDRTLGIGAGQMSRVDSARIAVLKAGDQQLSLQAAVMASDAFFPFRDAIDTAVEQGIKAIIQPGGSIRDNEVIAAADEAQIAMVFTGIRHFKH